MSGQSNHDTRESQPTGAGDPKPTGEHIEDMVEKIVDDAGGDAAPNDAPNDAEADRRGADAIEGETFTA